MSFLKNNLRIVMGLFILTFTAYGQSTPYNSVKEKNWYQTHLVSASKNGAWIHYLNAYLDDTETAAIKNIKTSETFEFPKGSWGEFSDNSKWFTIPTSADTLIVVDLIKKEIDTIPKVKYSYFDGTGGDYLITQSPEDAITLVKLDTKKQYNLGRSNTIAINPSKNVVAIALMDDKKESLEIFDIKTRSSFKVMGGKNMEFQRLTWNATGEKLTFLYSHNGGKNYDIGVFDLKSQATLFLDAHRHLSNGESIANAKLSISDLGDRVFFEVKPRKTESPENNSAIEIWDTFDPVLYTRKNFITSKKQGPWLHVWLPKKDKVIPLADMEMPEVLFNPNSDYALGFDPYAKEPQFRFNTFVDIYVIDIRTGIKTLVVANQYTGTNHVHFSPQGRYVAYFKDHQWWLYDIQKRKYTNLTRDLPNSCDHRNPPNLDITNPYELAGWTKDETALFLYDEFDVWKISNDGKKKEKLTNGRASKTIFRLVYGEKDQRTKYGSLGFNTYSIDEKDGILLAGKNRRTLQNSYHQLKNNTLREITRKDKHLSGLIQLGKDGFVFTRQSFAEPISIEYVNLKTKSEKTIYKSNPEWNRFKWPKRELIWYNTEIADSLKGVLIYPIDYDATKKYPMVVHIYTEQSFFYHRYCPPSAYDDVGFNFMNYALDGYFVFLPDIKSKGNAPGTSATICVEGAVKTALKTVAAIDQKRIGLIGHSYGGYETAFIITQSDMFAAAVVGCGIFNLESFYFDIYKMAGIPEIIRVERGSFQMNASYFENPEAYRANSPLHRADNINTPLLIWAGKDDINVNPNQSLQGYLALRRLKKPAKLYYYAGESHVIGKNENKRDLTNRIKNWFEEYLK